MKKIAIFVSGNGEAAERIVKLFNEGNRLRTELVFTDDSASELSLRLKGEDVTLIHIPDAEWDSESVEIAELLKEHDIKLIVLDNFNGVLASEILEAVDGELIRVTSEENAPREVVAALEADLRKAQPTIPAIPKEENGEKTPEAEWADTLKIQFTPPAIPSPSTGETEMKDVPNPPFNEPYNEKPEFMHNPLYQERPKEVNGEPMPSTWLIWSVLSTVFCCFIPGIIAIIFSSQVSSKYYAGDIEGSKRASRNAEIWIIVSVVLGVLAATLYLPFMILSM